MVDAGAHGAPEHRRRRRRSTRAGGPPKPSASPASPPPGAGPDQGRPLPTDATAPGSGSTPPPGVPAPPPRSEARPRTRGGHDRRSGHDRHDRHGGHDRHWRDLAGIGQTQLDIGAALRARDATRPTPRDLAEAQAEVTVVHRNWKPTDTAK